MTSDTTILLIQSLIAAAGVIVSVIVARYFGEYSATKFTLRETKKRRHSNFLCAEPLKQFTTSLPYAESEGTITCRDDFGGKIFMRIFTIEDRMPTDRLLMSHLKTGYQKTLESILDFQKSYKNLCARSLNVYEKVQEYFRTNSNINNAKLIVKSANRNGRLLPARYYEIG